MSRGCFFVLVMAAAIGVQPLLARPLHESPTDDPSAAQPTIAQQPVGAAPADEAGFPDGEAEIPRHIRDNPYLQESQRLTALAQETYRYGDYELSASLAGEAIYYAQLSDEYVTQQLRILAINQAIAAAKSRLDRAESSGASRQRPAEYGEAETWYQRSLAARSGEDWDGAYDAAQRVIDILSFVQMPAGSPARATPAGNLPATYTVRAWATYGDCFWNIAARPWVYGDGQKWGLLYDANKSKLPDPGNPNLIEPGMVIEIPNMRGEARQGAWNPSAAY